MQKDYYNCTSEHLNQFILDMFFLSKDATSEILPEVLAEYSFQLTRMSTHRN